MWQVGFSMRLPRPLARAVKRFSVSLVDVDGLDLQLVDVGAVVVLGVGDCRLTTFLMMPAAFFGEKVRMFSACRPACRGSGQPPGAFLRREAGTARIAFTSILIAPYFLAFLSAA
jgi:hypothetical protein